MTAQQGGRSRTKGFLRAAAKPHAVDVDYRAANLVKTPRSKKANTLSIVCGLISLSVDHWRDPIVLFSPHLLFRPQSLATKQRREMMAEKKQQQTQRKKQPDAVKSHTWNQVIPSWSPIYLVSHKTFTPPWRHWSHWLQQRVYAVWINSGRQ